VRRKLIKALHAGGAGLLLGSDAPQVYNVPGFSTHRELETLVASGLTPYEALETGTRNVAVFFGTLKETGTVEQGKRADLVLLDADPLQDVRNTTKRSGVMLRGRWLPRAEIDAKLAAIARAVGR
jgi:imidazolonepropionase-like amidohydrolase